jgi:hypothetical protein
MGRKKQQDTGAATDQTAAGGIAGTGSATMPGDKTQAVKLALRDGLRSPTEIAKHVRSKYGMDITPNYVSVIKGKMKKSKKKGKAKHAAEGEAKGTPGRPPASKTGLSPQDLVDLAGLAKKAGGYEKLQEFLNALHRIK